MTDKRFLIIPDTHFPYHHKDTFKFLQSVQEEYGLTTIKHTGDIVDNHSGSYHEIVYGSLSAQDEYKKAVESCQKLESIFPKLTIVEGNHDRITKRKAQTAGVPEDHLKSYNDIYQVGEGWKFLPSEVFTVKSGMKCLLTHSVGASTKANAQKYSNCSIQGHHHGEYGISYYADQASLRWAMTVGCMVDHHAPAFAYAKDAILKKPILGCAIITNGVPALIPMELTSRGSWKGRLPKLSV